MYPISSAMDATASCGGPMTVLPQIVTGQPEEIARHAAGLAEKAEQFLTMYAELTKAAEQLGRIWSGEASESALQKITDLLDQLTEIIDVVREGAGHTRESESLGLTGVMSCLRSFTQS